MSDAPALDHAGPRHPEVGRGWLAAIIASSDDAIVSADAEHVITTWNPGAELLYGYTAAEAIGQPVTILLPRDRGEEMSRLVERLQRGERIDRLETVRKHKDGRLIDISISLTPIVDATGRVLGSAAVARDITERKRLDRELSVRTRQQAVVAELSQRALAGDDLSTLLNEAVALIAHTLELEHCTILELLPDGTALRFRAGVGWRDGVVRDALVPTGRGSQAGYTLETGGPVIVHDMREEQRFGPYALLLEHNIVSGISVIIPGQEQPFGVLSMHARQVRPFTADDIHFLEAAANVLASAIKRTSTEQQLRERLEQRVAERTQELSTLLEVSNHVASTLELTPLLGVILAQLSAVVDYTAAGIFIVEGNHVRMLDYRGPRPREAMVGVCIPLAQAVGYQAVLRQDGPVIVDDLSELSPLAEAFRGLPDHLKSTLAGVRSVLVVPLKVMERLIGVVRVDHHLPHAFTPRQASLAVAIANQAAMAIENARLFARAQETATLEERQRLARELHDSVTQALYGVTLYAEAAASTLAAGDPETANANVREIRTIAREALQEMRLLIFELRPSILEQEGLAAALQARLTAVEGRTAGLTTHIAVEADLRLPGRVEEALYRIAQEALNNVFKHAHARTVTVALRRAGPTVRLEIADDGAGFVREAGRGGGIGLHSMQERADLIGARLTIESAPGRGTAVQVEVPRG
jgi:PAS domain S-box-containing protein